MDIQNLSGFYDLDPRSLLEHCPQELFLFCPNDFQIIFMNLAIRKHLDYTVDDVRQLTLSQIVPDIGIFDGANDLEIQTRLRAKDGQDYPVALRACRCPQESGAVFIAVAEMITEKIEAQTERDQLAAALHHISESIILTDAQRCILYVNPAFESMTGYAAADVSGRDIRFLNSEDGAFSKMMWSDTALESGNHLVSLKTKDGESIQTSLTLSPVFDEHNKVATYAAILYDLSREERLKKQLFRAQKMEALGILAGGIAHDFNNMIFAMMLGIDMVADRLPPERKDLRGILEQTLIAGERARDLIQQILTFSRQSEQTRHEVDVAPIVKETVKLLKATLPSTIEIQQSIGKSCGLLLADPTQIHQVLMNLSTNAAHAMKEAGGILQISLNQEQLDPEMAGPLGLNAGAFLKLSIADSGCGISPELRDLIFDPFFTTKALGEGTGLGLAVVKGIVETQNGALSLHSELGKGTRFDVYFPTLEKEVLTKERTEDRPIPKGSGHILIVDDEEIVVTLLGGAVASLGYRVTTTSKSPEGLALFQANPHDFDLVITDQTMPKMTGEELARAMLKLRPDLPIILITGYTDKTNAQKAAEVGIKAFMAKPLSKLEIAQTIHRLLH